MAPGLFFAAVSAGTQQQIIDQPGRILAFQTKRTGQTPCEGEYIREVIHSQAGKEARQ